MNTLNLGSDDEPVVKKKSNTRNLKIALGLAAVILIPTIGSTLAGAIVVSGGSVEFGQGISQAAACGNLTLTPAAGFTNASGAGSFKLNTVTLSALPSTCTTKTFTIKAYGASGDTPLVLTARTGSAAIVTPTYSSGDCTVVIPSTPASPNETAACTSADSVGSVVITVGSSALAAGTIYKFTVESS